MDEATARKRRIWRRFRPPSLRSQRGQTIIEYILMLLLALGFTRFVFFNRDYGLKAMLDNTMLRFGVFLEQNLKTGTKRGGDGIKSLEAFAGTDRWSN